MLQLPQVYVQSNSGREVRHVVQRLNAERGRLEEAAECAPPTATDPVAAVGALQTAVGPSEEWSAYVKPEVMLQQHDTIAEVLSSSLTSCSICRQRWNVHD